MNVKILKITAIVLFLAVDFYSCKKPADNFAGIAMTTQIVRHVYFRMAGTGSVTIDWGDKTPAETFVLTPFKEEYRTEFEFKHDYSYDCSDFSNCSSYTIKISGENITFLSCSRDEFTWGFFKDLDVRSCKTLTRLNCSYNRMTSLDVSKNTSLTYLICGGNQLTNLDVQKNTALTYLNCDFNEITNLDVSKNTSLTNLSCGGNQLTNLDVSNNTKLTHLECWSNRLTNLDVSKLKALTHLSCGTQLADLDVSNNAELIELWCSNNQLTSLDVSKNTKLKLLICYNNSLTSLDVSKNTMLDGYYCLNCQLNKLSIEALNNLFKTLHSNPPLSDSLGKGILINGNPGTDECDYSIAENKGWTVYK